MRTRKPMSNLWRRQGGKNENDRSEFILFCDGARIVVYIEE